MKPKLVLQAILLAPTLVGTALTGYAIAESELPSIVSADGSITTNLETLQPTRGDELLSNSSATSHSSHLVETSVASLDAFAGSSTDADSSPANATVPLFAEHLQESSQTSPAIAFDDAESSTPSTTSNTDSSSAEPNAIATPTPNLWLEQSEPMAQVTSVTELSDVQPTDWAYQALQSLIENYGCIVGYPDRTYRGDRALSRYEFAAGVNACLDRIDQLLENERENLVSLEDLEVLQRLLDEFAAEIEQLRGRVDDLEARTAVLEANQFSTTTKLYGEAIFSIADLFGDSVDGGNLIDASGAPVENNTVFYSRVRLDFVTSFTGQDALHTRFAAGTVVPFETPGLLQGVDEGTKEGLLIPRVSGVTDTDFVLDWLAYYFPVGDRVSAFVSAAGGEHHHYVFSTVNPYFEDFDGGNGSISVFSQESPIYRIGGGAGAGLNVFLDDNERFVLSMGYLADEANITSSGSGLFNGDYAALGQLTITPADFLQLGLTYVHGYHTRDNFIFDLGEGDDFFTGTTFANGTHVALGVPVVSNSYGIEASVQLGDNVAINAFAGYTDLIFINTGDGEVWYYGLALAFPDLFKEGNLGGIMVGVEPYLGSFDQELVSFEFENDTSLHIEGFYKFQVNDNLSITPGVIVVTAPEQDSSIDPYVVGTIRATFQF